MATRLRLVALISGGGTTLQNLIDRISAGKLNAAVVGVVSSRADAFGVERAKKAGLPVTVVPRAKDNQTPQSSSLKRKGEEDLAPLPSGEGLGRGQASPPRSLSGFAQDVWSAVRGYKPDLVIFAGWLHLLPIPADFHHKVLNIHPALLPAFGGKGMHGHHVHEAVLAHGCKVSGCTVHFADATYDTGPIVVQKCVPVKEGDDAPTLAARVFEAECEAYPEAIALIAAGRVRVEGRRVVILGEPAA